MFFSTVSPPICNFCWNIKETSGFPSFLFTLDGCLFCRIDERGYPQVLMPEMAVTAATTQHNTEAMSALLAQALPVRETVK